MAGCQVKGKYHSLEYSIPGDRNRRHTPGVIIHSIETRPALQMMGSGLKLLGHSCAKQVHTHCVQCALGSRRLPLFVSGRSRDNLNGHHTWSPQAPSTKHRAPPNFPFLPPLLLLGTFFSPPPLPPSSSQDALLGSSVILFDSLRDCIGTALFLLSFATPFFRFLSLLHPG